MGETHADSMCGRVHRALQRLGAADVDTIAATIGEDRAAVRKAMESLVYRGITYRVPSQYTLHKPPEQAKGIAVVKIPQREWCDL